MEDKPYWKQRQKMKLKGAATAAEVKDKKKKKGNFFAGMISRAGNKCENCGKDLSATKAINPAAIIAHILPKNEEYGVPSVALDPLNTWQGCGDCHTDYDNKGAKFVQSMAVFPQLKARVAKFYDKIPEKERRRVPEYFRPLNDAQ
jgi:hypothetical protein